VKRDRANDIAHPGEKVGQRQTPYKNAPAKNAGAFYFVRSLLYVQHHTKVLYLNVLKVTAANWLQMHYLLVSAVF
jgi:hypothetical protein